MKCFNALPLVRNVPRGEVLVPICVQHNTVDLLPFPGSTTSASSPPVIYAITTSDTAIVYEARRNENNLKDLDQALLSELLDSYVTIYEIIESMVKVARIPRINIVVDGFAIETTVEQYTGNAGNTVSFKVVEVFPPPNTIEEIVANVLNNVSIEKVDKGKMLEVEAVLTINEPEHGNAVEIIIKAWKTQYMSPELGIAPPLRSIVVSRKVVEKLYEGLRMDVHLDSDTSSYHLHRAREIMKIIAESLSLINITQ